MGTITPRISLSLRCLAPDAHSNFLDGRTADGSVGLAPATDGPFTGSHWEAVDDGPNRVILRCLAPDAHPNFLDGRTANGSVGLAPSTGGVFTGTHWEVVDDGRNQVILRCLAPDAHPNFLDGRTADGSVGLAPATDGVFTGTHWEVVDPIPNDPQFLDAGPLTSGLPLGGSVHLVMRRNGDFTFSSHAHDSGFDNIDYVVSAVLMTPSGIAFTFQHSGHVEGTIAAPFGTPNRDDNFVTSGNNPSVTNEFGDIPGAKLVASIDGKDTLVGGIEGILNDLLKQVAGELEKAAAKAVVALVFA
jgi:hypothetical protein